MQGSTSIKTASAFNLSCLEQPRVLAAHYDGHSGNDTNILGSSTHLSNTGNSTSIIRGSLREGSQAL
jgi:hypothetical protein